MGEGKRVILWQFQISITELCHSGHVNSPKRKVAGIDGWAVIIQQSCDTAGGGMRSVGTRLYIRMHCVM